MKNTLFLSGFFNNAFYLTITGVICSFSAVYFSFIHNLGIALILFMAAGIADLFDGVIARKLTLSPFEKMFGIQIDSLVDAISFGITPMIIIIHAGYFDSRTIFFAILYTVCSIIRLAYYNSLTIDKETRHPYFTGLPVTYSALIFPILITLSFWFTSSIMKYIMIGSTLIISILFVLNIKIPRPSKIFYLIFPFIALIISGIWICKSCKII